MKVNRSLYFLAFVLIAGCSGKGSETTSTTPATTPQPVEKVGLGIPEELVTDGLKLMGYPFDKTIVYKVDGFPTGSSSTQTMSTTFEAKAEGQNVLTFNYAGEPSNLPSEGYALEKDAIFGVAAGGDEISPKVKAMPATITIGDKWPTKASLQNGKIVMDTGIKIVGRQQVTVPAGDYEALVVIESGTITVDGKMSKVEGKSWYVEGIGAVKRTISQTDSSGKTSNLSMEADSIRTHEPPTGDFQVSVGMRFEEVVKKLGSPSTVRDVGETSRFIYPDFTVVVDKHSAKVIRVERRQ